MNYLANRATDTFQAGLSISYARFNDTLVDGYVSGPLTDTVRARLAFNVERADGWQYSVTRPDERNGRKNLSSGRLLLDWKPSDDWSIGLNINGGLDRSDTQAAQFRGPTISEPGFSLLKNNRPELFNFPIAPNKARAADFDPKLDLSQRNSLWQTALTVQHQLTGYVALKSITSFVQFKQFQPLDTDGTPYDAFGGPVSGNLKSLYQELRVQREGEGLNWIVGANYIRDKIVERQRSTSTQSGFSIVGVSAFDNNNRQKADTKSIYGNITYSFAEGLKLESGLRYTKQKRNFTACSRADDIVTATIYSNRLKLPIAIGDCLTLGPTGVPGVQRDKLVEDSLSWRATLNWQASADFLAYATVSRGYKGGSFPISGATSYLQYRPVKQESLLDLEAGLKASLFDRRAQLNLAGFYYEYQDKQVRGKFIDAATKLAFSGLVNVPKSRLYGAEAQLSLRLSRALTIGADATYVNSKISAPFANVDFYGFSKDFEGEPLPFAPKWSMVGRADFDQPVTEHLTFFAGANVNYQSSTNAALGQQPAADIRSFYTLDVRAGIRTLDDKVTVSVWGRNITNQYYWTGVNLVLDVVSRYAAQPATYGMTLSYKI
ncbi:hypothetical protein CAF53_26150 [Sphingobium sp. LB126]|uniref:TonB-dependent receptor n=1 Tax=Sphingobium sp. LB126 TaxID=1983755 RepID=UPI000C1FF8BB|nr:hypothetical protein CAF53_26150 [Sphingobium sp. LB126]